MVAFIIFLFYNYYMSKDTVQIHKQRNSLTIIACPNDNPHSFFVRLSIRAGSRYEDAKTNGLSHLVEHLTHRFLAHKIKHDYPTLRYILEEFNAYTDVDEISYEIEAHRRDFQLVLKFLSEIFQFRPLLKDIKIEREIIKEEILGEQNQTGYNFERFVRQNLFSGNSLSLPILGSSSNLERFTVRDITDFFAAYYQPQNIVLIITGSFDEQEALTFGKRIQLSVLSSAQSATIHYQKFACPSAVTRFLPSNKQQSFFGRYFCLPVDSLSSALKLDLFLDSIRYQLVETIRSEAFCYNFDLTAKFYPEAAIIGLEAELASHKIIRLQRLLQQTINKVNRDFHQRDLQHVKNDKIISLELDSDYPRVVARELAWQYLTYGSVLDYPRQKELLNSFSMADFKKHFRGIFIDGPAHLLVTGKLGRLSKDSRK